MQIFFKTLFKIIYFAKHVVRHFEKNKNEDFLSLLSGKKKIREGGWKSAFPWLIL